jgi:hypothetical protein
MREAKARARARELLTGVAGSMPLRAVDPAAFALPPPPVPAKARDAGPAKGRVRGVTVSGGGGKENAPVAGTLTPRKSLWGSVRHPRTRSPSAPTPCIRIIVTPPVEEGLTEWVWDNIDL